MPALGAGIAGVRAPTTGTPTSDRAAPVEFVARTSAFEVHGSSGAKTTDHAPARQPTILGMKVSVRTADLKNGGLRYVSGR